ncbi:MAG TPA: RluA family pseudouridine synthase [Bacteroidales bacterium]|nr:RluA family pseudouridine synthase [Bacteroidales bacterium]
MKSISSQPITLLDHLLAEFGTASRTTVKKRIVHGNVTVNGKMETNPARMLKEGDIVEYVRQVVRINKVKPPYPVLFEDESILVAVKPAGLLTIGDRGTGGTSFYQQLLAYVRENSKGKEKLFVVHRLDREVSGLLLFTKSEKLQEAVKNSWGNARKLYYALVEGQPKEEKGVIRSWLMEGHDQKVFSVRDEQKGARMGVTHYRVMDRTPDYALLEIELETGRKNQIRVHLSEMGCPVVGDRRYGADARYVRRIRLHAFYLSLAHPVTGELREFKSPMPRGFLELKPGDEKYK